MLEIQLTEEIPYQAELISLEKDLPLVLESVYPAIGFVTEANVEIYYSSFEKKSISKGQLFLLPRDFACRLESDTSQQILLLKIPNMTAVYIHFMPPIPKNKIGDFEQLFFPLDITDTIEHLIRSITLYIEENMHTNQLLGLKVHELFYFINHCYSEDLHRHFFAPILTKEYVFALFVLSNYNSVKNADELARLSNYTFSGFDKQFRKVFGTAPYKWILQKKIHKIYVEISGSSKPIKVIAEEFGFTNSSQLGDFCRKHIGLSPALIRKKEIG